jgi:hypothetical protein
VPVRSLLILMCRAEDCCLVKGPTHELQANRQTGSRKSARDRDRGATRQVKRSKVSHVILGDLPILRRLGVSPGNGGPRSCRCNESVNILKSLVQFGRNQSSGLGRPIIIIRRQKSTNGNFAERARSILFSFISQISKMSIEALNPQDREVRRRCIAQMRNFNFPHHSAKGTKNAERALGRRCYLALHSGSFHVRRAHPHSQAAQVSRKKFSGARRRNFRAGRVRRIRPRERGQQDGRVFG